MQHLPSFLRKLTAVAAVTLLLGGCHRAEYAVLPKTSPYHATYHAPVKPAPIVVEESAIATRQTPTAAPVAATPPTAPFTPQVAATPASRPAKPVAPTTPRRAGLLQKMLVNKVTKKADKLTAKLLKQPQNAAEVNRISGYLRTGILLVLIGLLITIIPGDTFQLVGTIVAIIGVVFLVLWLLDNL